MAPNSLAKLGNWTIVMESTTATNVIMKGGLISGAGVLKITGSNTYGGDPALQGATRIQVGTLLVDNTAGSGTGKSYVTVSGGATLGGTGSIGGLADATIANVSLTGTSVKSATLEPGSIDETSGALSYTPTSIEFTVHPKGTVFLIR